ncbi:MAG: histidine phosphatase family protein [Pseudomonadota bacterium]
MAEGQPGRVNRLCYLTHPQVVIDPAVPVPNWGLNEMGQKRVASLASYASQALAGTVAVYASPERKAQETAGPVAEALGLPVNIRDDSYENDRSATGYLPGPAFEAMADRFFATPELSVDGWEPAIDAQARIVAAAHAILSESPPGHILMVGHGAVGTLLMSHAAGWAISRDHDQPVGGGNAFSIARDTGELLNGWIPMEKL